MVVDASQGVELLLDVGLDRRILSSVDVEIGTDDGRWSRRRVLALPRSPSPAALDRAIAAVPAHQDGIYVVVGRAGSALLDASARDPRVAYGAVDDGVVGFRGKIYRVRPDGAATSRHGRASWARLAALRLFALTGESLSQSAIARRIGLSHVAVSKQLPELSELVERTPNGWRAVDRNACWERFLADYPGPGGLSSYWTTTADIADSLARIESLQLNANHRLPVVSGDLAADFYAPWRRPDHLVVYVVAHPALDELGFAAVPRADATVKVCVPRDPTILPLSHGWTLPELGRQRRYADPLVTAWDLGRTPGGDVETALVELRRRILQDSPWS
jgi:hypothetical protein